MTRAPAGPSLARSPLLPSLLALLLAGCAGDEKYREETIEFSVGPAYREESVDIEGRKFAQRDVLWPFYHEEHDEESGRHSYAVRPFFHYSYDDEGKFEQTMSLWPIAWFREHEDEKNSWVLPFYFNNQYTDLDGNVDDDTLLLFPLFWFGERAGVQQEAVEQGFESDRGSYFAFVPFYGTLKGYLGKDNIEFIMFPFYWNSNDGPYETEGYFWPGGNWTGEGPDKHGKSYFPFYIHVAKDGSYDRKTYMWPFVHEQTNRLNTPYPETSFFAWPFYGEAKAEGKTAYTFIWPLFNFADDERIDYHSVEAPWPFFATYESPQVRGFRIWPLYGFTENIEGFRRDFLLFPILWRWKDDTKYYKKSVHMVAPLFKIEEFEYRDGSEAEEILFWPLFQTSKDREGRVKQEALQFFPIEDFPPAGFETLWEPLIRLYAYESDPEKGESLQVLGPTYERRETPELYSERVLFFQYLHLNEAGRPEEKRFSFLGGFFEWIDRGDDSGFRFLWLPDMGLDDEKDE